jgi:hypothetical protein
MDIRRQNAERRTQNAKVRSNMKTWEVLNLTGINGIKEII